MANLKTLLNLYWSFRRYLYSNGYGTISGIPTYYNPTIRPSNIGEKFLIVVFQDDRMGKLSYSFPRIYCVAKADPELIKLTELVSGVVSKFDETTTSKRTFTLYNQPTGASLGLVEVTNVRVRPHVPWEEGWVARAIDLDLRYVVEGRHL